MLIQDIMELISQSNATLCHTRRDGNQYADFLVKLGASLKADLSIPASMPEDILNINF
jgi:hypothetical protein